MHACDLRRIVRSAPVLAILIGGACSKGEKSATTGADSSAWAAQKEAQKTARLQQLREQRVQMFLQDLRKSAKVVDRRKEINATLRRQQA